MDALQIFLSTLEERLHKKGTHQGTYIVKRSIKELSFKACKVYYIEVWLVEGSNKQLITTAETKGTITNDSEKQKVLETLYHLVIKDILKYYGI